MLFLGREAGLIDFYFACNDFLAYDVAVCLNAWCFERDFSFNLTKGAALLRGYVSVRPLSGAERSRAEALATEWGLDGLEESAPISVVGSGPDLNSATDNGLKRAAELLSMEVPEVMNRATISGAIEIGRHPGVVQVTFRAPLDRLEERGLASYVGEQYGG